MIESELVSMMLVLTGVNATATIINILIMRYNKMIVRRYERLTKTQFIMPLINKFVDRWL